MTPQLDRKETIYFGSFSLVSSERRLTKEGAFVKLSARALDILIALLSRPNELVTKNDLLARVWPDVTVEEGSLRFHIACLRKILGDGKYGARYIATLNGRGYCFVAPISRSADHNRELAEPVAGFPHADLPTGLIRMVGRDDDVPRLANQLIAARFVTIVGSGGVGKSTVAIAVGHRLMEAFAGSVVFVDLGTQSDPNLVATAVASKLGLYAQSDDATQSLIAYLREKRILLILDTCEHLIEAVAALVSRIFMAAPQLHILATSREALRVEEEHVYRLEPLACPPNDPGLTATVARTFPAVELFVDHALASGVHLDFNDREAAVVESICRKLDGVPLAIEFAAARVESYGLQQIALLLDQPLAMLWPGPRTAPSRQRTMEATLNWSYGLLSEQERFVLRRLAIFVDHFTLDAALAVVPGADLDRSVVLGAIDRLVAKSMIATHANGPTMRYRLLQMTRNYALEINGDAAESADLASRRPTTGNGSSKSGTDGRPYLPAGRATLPRGTVKREIPSRWKPRAIE